MESGRPGQMQLFPAKPHPGHPGADASANRRPWAYPQRLPYPGSVEHWRVWNPHYIEPIPPFNYRTLVKNFPAQQMEGVTPAMCEQWAEPVEFAIRGQASVYPGQYRDPVPVVRLKPGGDSLKFKLEPLPTGLYCVRLIAAIESKNVEAWGKSPQDLILTMTINDGPQGRIHQYALRQRANDNFYSLGEFFFHVEDARRWEITLGLHADSNIDLLVHNVDVHDMLAETAKQAGKKRSIHISPQTLKANWARDEAAKAREDHENRIREALEQLQKAHPDKTPAQVRELWREQRDLAIWSSLPPKNFNYLSFGTTLLRSQADPENQAKLEKSASLRPEQDWINGGWFPELNPPNPNNRVPFWSLDFDGPWRMVWRKGENEQLQYNAEDLLAHKPLPGLPFQVKPWGKSFDGPEGRRSLLFPITQAYNSMFRYCRDQIENRSKNWIEYGSEDAAHDAAMYLIRLAYDLPTYSESHALNIQFNPRGATFNRLNVAHQDRVTNGHVNWENLAQQYDQLFTYIQGNQKLAASVGKHIKWVKTPQDVIALLDTYVIQYGARETLYLRFYFDHQHSRMLANFAAMQTNPRIAEPWIKAMFDRTWEYPHRYGSVENFMYLATQRDGTQTIGSFFYAGGGTAAGAAAPLVDEYIADGGDPRYQLSNLKLYPRIGQFPYWLLESRVAGLHPLQVGDVGGPTLSHGYWFNGNQSHMNLGWRWTGDPRFAWVVANLGSRRTETDEQWAQLQQAAKTLQRNPFLANRTRVLTDWGAILEGHAESDDFRFRHAARLRIGKGVGHAHNDMLDLGLWSLGLVMSGDMGARGGYGRPGVDQPSLHNLVTVNKSVWPRHAWVRELADLDQLQYMNVDTLSGPQLTRSQVTRQVAMIELDRGQPSAQSPSDNLHHANTVYGKDITLPKAYFVDFSRTIGGSEHSYNFHGPTEDQFQTNVSRGALNPEDEQWFNGYVIKGEQWAAPIDQDVLLATWRLGREPITFHIPGRGDRTTRAPEPAMMGPNYDPASPRKFLRLHVPGQKDQRVRSGVSVSGASDANRTDGDWLRQVHIIRKSQAEPASSLFAAVWEPYAGEPFITEVKLQGDTADARSFAALQVKTRQGQRDLIYSDPADPKLRELEGDVKVHGSFAYVSRDDGGLRRVSLTAGRELSLPEVSVKLASAWHEAKVKSLDYLNNTAILDQPLPKVLAGRFFEVGTNAKGLRYARWSNFEVTRLNGNQLTWRKGADGGMGQIQRIQTMAELKAENPGGAGHWERRGATQADALLHLEMETGIPDGRDSQMALRKSVEGQQIIGDVQDNLVLVKAADAQSLGLAVGDRIRLYEMAEGDTFRTNTQFAMWRQADKTYRIQADVPFVLSLRATQAWCSTDDGATWQMMSTSVDRKDQRDWSVTSEQIDSGRLRVKWE